MIKAIVFDFDGVITDSVNIKTEAFFELYKPFGSEIARQVVKHHLINTGISRFEKIALYHKNFLGIALDEREILKIADDFSKLVVDKVVKAPYISGAFEFICEHAKNFNCYISSATPDDEIKKIVKLRNIDSYFVDIFGSPQKKITHLRAIFDTYKYHNHEVVFIGDSKSDLQAANEAAVHFIAVKNETDTQFQNEKYQIENLVYLKDILLKIEKDYKKYKG